MSKKNNLLYLDDEDSNLIPFKAFFRKKYEVYTANNGEDAFKVLENHNIHIIITDQRMPNLNGIEFLEKTIEKYPDAIRLLITAYSELDIVIEAINRGRISKFLQKPWDWEKLSLAIENCALIYNANQDLKKKNLELQKANDELSKFVYSISHDLREPLTTILGLINLTEKENYVGVENYITMIKTCVLKHDTLTRNMINYYKNSHAQKIKNSINFKELEVNLYNYIKDLDDNVNFESDIEQITPFEGDLFRLEIILKNLLSNAVKYQNPINKRSEIKLKIHSDKESVTIIVSDNGIGIKPEYISKIFTLFFRAGVPGNKEGSGIGLYIVKEALEKLNGTIEVESTPMIGTIFKIVIPNLL